MPDEAYLMAYLYAALAKDWAEGTEVVPTFREGLAAVPPVRHDHGVVGDGSASGMEGVRAIPAAR